MIFKQIRTGKDNKRFEIYKIKTMKGVEMGPAWNTENNPRITTIGKLLRKYHIDELPQLWNIIKRDMNLVGPRPERPYFDFELSTMVNYRWFTRYRVRPGIMGLAQLRQGYVNTVKGSMRKLRYDLFYIEKRSLGFDLWIIWKTIIQTLRG